MKTLKPWLALGCLALSACGPLEEMDIVPIKYAPVTVISSRVVPPAAGEPATSGSGQQVPEINGCWEYTPADAAQPIIRRAFAQLTGNSYTYHYSAAEIRRDGSNLTEMTEKGTANYMPRQSQVSLSVSGRYNGGGVTRDGQPSSLKSGSRKEAATRSDATTLELDGLVYTKLDLDPCW